MRSFLFIQVSHKYLEKKSNRDEIVIISVSNFGKQRHVYAARKKGVYCIHTVKLGSDEAG